MGMIVEASAGSAETSTALNNFQRGFPILDGDSCRLMSDAVPMRMIEPKGTERAKRA